MYVPECRVQNVREEERMIDWSVCASVCERERVINVGPLNLNFLRYGMEGVWWREAREGGTLPSCLIPFFALSDPSYPINALLCFYYRNVRKGALSLQTERQS